MTATNTPTAERIAELKFRQITAGVTASTVLKKAINGASKFLV
jgi:hypothetical protein